MKTVAIIPAMLNSKRLHNKNLIMVDGYPMIFYVVDACKKSNVFDKIYINSEYKIFEKISKMLGVEFYQRNPNFGGSSCNMKNISSNCQGKRCQVHDHYLFDFIQNINCDNFVQVHTTSPLIKSETISGFVKTLGTKYDCLFSSVDIKEESFYDGFPINFNGVNKLPTQDLKPIESISWALSGWKKETFMKNYETGPSYQGNLGLYKINKIEAIDVDTEDDLYIAEACLNHMKRKENKRFYFDENIISIEKDLRDLIQKDGSPLPEKLNPNNDLTKYTDVMKIMGDGSWCYPVVLTDNDQCCFIQQQPGEGCRKHYHTVKDEWWIVIKGSFKWIIGNGEREIHANEKEIVYLPKGTVHQIECTSKEFGIRLAAGGRDMDHVYVK